MRARLLLIVLAFALLPTTVRAAPTTMQDLVRQFHATTSLHPDERYAAQRTILEQVADRKSNEARDTLRQLLDTHGAADRRQAVELLGALVRNGSSVEVDHMVRWVERSRDPFLVELMPAILARIRTAATWRFVRGPLLQKATPTVKAQVARALGERTDPASVMPLMKLLQGSPLRVRVESLLALGKQQDPRARVPIELFLRNEDHQLRATAAQALGAMGDPASVPALVKALDDPHTLVVESAGEALGAVGTAGAIEPLIRGLARTHETNLRLADVFTEALRKISGKGIAPDPELWDAWWQVAKTKPLVKRDEKAPANSVAGPRYYGFPVRSSKVVFVLDNSRSMGWNHRLDMAQDELTRTLETLPRATRFNVIVYSDRAHAWKPKLTLAKTSAVASAIRFVRKQRPDNGTNTHEALQVAFRDPDADTVFLLSDGHPSVGVVVDPALIRVAVKDWNRFRRMRVHCIALMSGEPPPAFAGREDPLRAATFLRALAEDNHGWFRDVR